MQAQAASAPVEERVEPAALPEPAASPVSREVEPAVIGTVLWRRRRSIALAAGLCVAVALAYCLTATPQYSATAQILVDPRDKQVVSNDVNPSAIAADGGVTQVESQGSVLQSSGVLLRVMSALRLEQDPEFNGSGGLLARFLPFLRPATDPQDREAATLIALRKHVSVKRADKVLVLDLNVRANTPDKAASIANAIADAYLADQAQARADAGRSASKELAARLGELQGDVKTAETAVADYRASHNLVVSSGQLVNDQEVNQVTAQLTAAQNRVSSLKAQLDQLRRDPGAQGTPEAMSSAAMVRLRDRESAAVEKLAAASRQLGPLHPEIASLQQSLNDVRALIAREAQRLRQAAEADYARAQADEQSIAHKFDTLKGRSLEDDKADVKLRELQRQADAARTIYQAFLVRAKEILEASNVDTTNSRVITRALRPQQKSWPPTALLLLAAAFGGLSLGAAGALAHEAARPTLFTRAQAQAIAGVPVIGVVGKRALDRGGASMKALAETLIRQLTERAAVDEPTLGWALFVGAPLPGDPFAAALAEAVAEASAEEGLSVLLVSATPAETSSTPRANLDDVLGGDASVADAAYRAPGEAFSRLDASAATSPPPGGRRGSEAFRLRRLRRSYGGILLDGGAGDTAPRLTALAEPATMRALVVALGAPQGELAAAVERAGNYDGLVLIDPAERV